MKQEKKRSHVGYQCEILIDTYKWRGEEKNGTLDEQDRECYYAHSRAKNSVAFGYITVHGNSTENHDNQGEQSRRSYKKTVSTTCLNNKNLKPRTVHHHTNKPESVNIVRVRPFLKAAGGKAVCYILRYRERITIYTCHRHVPSTVSGPRQAKLSTSVFVSHASVSRTRKDRLVTYRDIIAVTGKERAGIP